MGARGASASSEAADVVILVNQLDRVSDAVVIARRTRAIAMQSIVVGMALSGLAMGAAAFGWLTPVAGALTQEAIDVAVILNALRALSPGGARRRASMPVAAAQDLREDHERLEASLDRLRQIADALDDADAKTAVEYVAEANRIVAKDIVEHELADENSVYPRLSSILSDGYGLFAMSRAHRLGSSRRWAQPKRRRPLPDPRRATHHRIHRIARSDSQCPGGGHLRERRNRAYF
jgi:hypothetical protein